MRYSTIQNIRLLYSEWEKELIQNSESRSSGEKNNLLLTSDVMKEYKYNKATLMFLRIQGIYINEQNEYKNSPFFEENTLSEANLFSELFGAKKNSIISNSNRKNEMSYFVKFRSREKLEEYNQFLASVPEDKYSYHDIGVIFALNHTNLKEYLVMSEGILDSILSKDSFDSIEVLLKDEQKFLLERLAIHRLYHIKKLTVKQHINLFTNSDMQIDEDLFHPVIKKQIKKQLNIAKWHPIFTKDLERIEYLSFIREKISIPRGIELLPNVKYISFIACGLLNPQIRHKIAYIDICLNDKDFDLIEQGRNEQYRFRLIYSKIKLLCQYAKAYDEYLLQLHSLGAHEYAEVLQEIRDDGSYYKLSEILEIREKWLLNNCQKDKEDYLHIELIVEGIIYLRSKIKGESVLEERIFGGETRSIYQSEKNTMLEKFILLLTEYRFSYSNLRQSYNYRDLPHYKKVIKITSKKTLKKMIEKCISRKNLLLEYNSLESIIAYLELLEAKKELLYSEEFDMKKTEVSSNIILNRNAIHPEIIKEIYKKNNKQEWEPLTLFDCHNIQSLSFVNKKINNPFGIELLQNLQYISFVACGVDKNCKLLHEVEHVNIISNNTVF